MGRICTKTRRREGRRGGGGWGVVLEFGAGWWGFSMASVELWRACDDCEIAVICRGEWARVYLF